MFRDFVGSLTCAVSGQNYCSGDVFGSSLFVEEICEEGKVIFRNKINGITFQKGQLGAKV